MNLIAKLTELFGLKGVNFGKPSLCKKDKWGLALFGLAALMLVFVFLPWLRYGVMEGKDLVAMNKLGITLWYGIVGLLGALVALFGVLYKKYAYTVVGALVGVIMGYLGTNGYADMTYEKNIIFQETFEAAARQGQGMTLSHIGANLFLLASALLLVVSLVQFCKEEKTEVSCISKWALGASAVLTAVITLDGILLTPTCLSAIAGNMLTWNLPLLVVALVVFAFYSDKKEGKSSKLNCLSVALLVVAFCFTNSSVIASKANILNRVKAQSVAEFYKQEINAYDTDAEQKELKKKQEKLQKKEGWMELQLGGEIPSKNNNQKNDMGY